MLGQYVSNAYFPLSSTFSIAEQAVANDEVLVSAD
jgi:hypothetical protein